MTSKTTDELRDIAREAAREVMHEELATEIDQAMEKGFRKYLGEAKLVNEEQAKGLAQKAAQELVTRRLLPLEERVQKLQSVFDTVQEIDRRLSGFLERANKIDQALARLDALTPFITGWPDDLERIEQKTENNRNDITALRSDAQTAMAGVVKLRVDIFGDPTAAVDLSLVGHITRQMADKEQADKQRHQETLAAIRDVVGQVQAVQAQVAQHATWIENRKKIEAAAVSVLKLGSQATNALWANRRIIALLLLGGAAGSGVVAGLLAFLSDPQVQTAIRDWLETLP